MTMIKLRDGSVRELRPGEILPDGASIQVPALFMDGALPIALHDGMGRPAGFAPGYAFAPVTTVADAKAVADKVAAFDGYVEHVGTAWKTPAPSPLSNLGHDEKTRPRVSLGDQATAERARLDYERRLTDGWRSA